MRLTKYLFILLVLLASPAFADVAGTIRVGTKTDGKGCIWNGTLNQIDCDTTDDDVPEAADFTNLTAGRSLTAPSTGTIDADVELYKDVKCINIDPTGVTTSWFMFRAPLAMTVIGVDCIVDVATSVVLTPRECDANGGTCSDIEAAITCATTNTTEASTVDNNSIDAGDYIRVTRGTLTGTATQAVICLELEYNE